MIAVSIFDMAKGINARSLHNGGLLDRDIASLVGHGFLLDRSVAELERPTDSLLMVGRTGSDRATYAWANLFCGTPPPLAKRPGDYCAVGLWMKSPIPTGMEIHDTLKILIDAFTALMRASKPNRWDPSALTLDDFGLPRSTIQFLNEGTRGGKTVGGRPTETQIAYGCLDLTGLTVSTTIGEWIDRVYREPTFDRFERVLLTDDKTLIGQIKAKGRVTLLRPDGVPGSNRASRSDLMPAVAARQLAPPKASERSEPPARKSSLAEDYDVTLQNDVDDIRFQLSALKKEGANAQALLSRRVRYLELIITVLGTLGVVLPMGWLSLSGNLQWPGGNDPRPTVSTDATSQPAKAAGADKGQGAVSSASKPTYGPDKQTVIPERTAPTADKGNAMDTASTSRRDSDSVSAASPIASTPMDIDRYTKDLLRTTEAYLRANRQIMNGDQQHFFDNMVSNGKHWLPDGKEQRSN